MSKNLQLFNFKNNDLRMIEENGEPWFIAKDVAEILGYVQTNNLNKIIDKEDKKMRTIQNGGIYIKQSLINESGLYQAIFNSTLPSAKEFKRWITKEVLPSIRKKGYYIDDKQKLTSQTPEKIYLSLAQELKRALPNLRITEQAVLLSDNHDETNLYYKQMSKHGLPGIIAVDKKPYKVIFDWYSQSDHSQEIRESLFKALYEHCNRYKSHIPGRKPFQIISGYVEVHGFKSFDEAQCVADDLAKIVNNSLRTNVVAQIH